MKPKTNDLYHQVVDVTADYLGPAAERFIERQVQSHLQKRPEDLRPKDVTSLSDWLRGALSVLTEDKNLVDEYARRLRELARPGAAAK